MNAREEGRLSSALTDMVAVLDPSERLHRLRQDIAVAAQEVYDAWDQDEEGQDTILGTGGICEEVASGISRVIDAAGVKAVTQVSGWDEHANIICLCRDGVFIVDIHPDVYETRHGYLCWAKKQGVRFQPEDVEISCLDAVPLGAALYFDPDVIASATDSFAAPPPRSQPRTVHASSPEVA